MISRAIKGFQETHFVEPVKHRKKYAEFGTNEYILCNPETSIPLMAKQSVIYGNKLHYFTFPICVVTEHTANWSLAKMTGSELDCIPAFSIWRIAIGIMSLRPQPQSCVS